jgi:putative ABC transport system permease protein
MVESLLLIVGIALGVGVAGAGIALVANSLRESKELLNSPQYKEIVVSLREDNADLDLPVVPRKDLSNIVLTTADLEAALDAPDVVYAYVASPVRFFVGDMPQGGPGGGPGGPGGGPPGGVPNQGGEGGAPMAMPEELSGYKVSPEFFSAWDMHAVSGSLFTDEDMAKGDQVIVLGSELAESMYGTEDPAGNKMKINGEFYTITGVTGESGTKYDQMAFIPAFMAEAVGGENRRMLRMQSWNTTLRFAVSDPERLTEAKAQLSSYFDRTFGEDTVIISIPREEAETAKVRSSRLVAVVLFLSIAGLFIAGVNVSNIMMSRALRKQRSVGVLKALGASKGDIFRLFSTEAMILCVAGGILGAGLCVLLSALMESTMGLSGVRPLILIAGILGAWIFTFAMTIVPAVHAAKVTPAEAIRTE